MERSFRLKESEERTDFLTGYDLEQQLKVASADTRKRAPPATRRVKSCAR